MDSELFTSESDFSLLPAHIITQILKHLLLCDFKNASSVCKSWYYASTDPQIVRNLVLRPKENKFTELYKFNRRYGILKLKYFKFDKNDNHYIELFEKFCPFVHELHINDTDIKIHHLLKIFELMPCLEVFSFSRCSQLAKLPKLFPLDYDCESKTRIAKNLSSLKNIAIYDFINVPFIAELVRYAINLNTFGISILFLPIEFNEDPYRFSQFFAIFDNDNVGKLENLNLEFCFAGWAEDLIMNFTKIKNLNLRSFRIYLWWVWENGLYKSSLFRQFILKLQTLEEFCIEGLSEDKVSITLICQYLVNLKSLDFLVHNDQPISAFTNLKQLQKLRCRFSQDYNKRANLPEIDKFFKYKFEHLRVFSFEGFVTESNLVQFCENHPNLIELKLTLLLTRNLEMIFKHLTKLRVLKIYFGFAWLSLWLVDRYVKDLSPLDTEKEYEYKISRLKHLEEFYLDELVNGIEENDVLMLKKLQSTNFPSLLQKD